MSRIAQETSVLPEGFHTAEYQSCGHEIVRSRRGRLHRWLLLLTACSVLLPILSGCGQAVNPPVRRDVAVETLKKVLQHWQEGGSLEGCAQWEPSVVVGEPLWTEGSKLTGFELGEERALDANLFVNVKLSVQANGRESNEVVQYCVGTDPVLTVFRSLQPVF